MLLLICICLVVTQPLFCSAFLWDKCFPEMLSGYQCYNLLAPYTNTLFHYPESPSEQEITFKLFTNLNPTTPQILGARDETSVQNSAYVKDGKVTFVIHGFTESADVGWLLDVVQGLLTKVPNVIAVDWERGARGVNYYRATANTRVVGAQVATMIKTIGVAPSKVHLIGFSLGAHICGYAGEKFTTEKIGRITGLDPAGPNFEDYDTLVRLDATDAAFVDIIHTDAQPLYQAGVGFAKRLGHVDFYPNRGYDQPGCGFFKVDQSDLSNLRGAELSCSHGRSHRYFNASINANVFEAYPCASVEDFDKCSSCGSGCNYMGYDATSSTEGLFVLNTDAEFPY